MALRLRLDEELDDAERASVSEQLAGVEGDAAIAYRRYVDARIRSERLASEAALLVSAQPKSATDPDIWRRSNER